MRLLTLISGIFLLLFSAGCLHPIENPYFTVKESGLNWVDIRHYQTGTPVHRVWVRLDGNGIVTVRSGTSSLVSNPFAKDYHHQQWEDIFQTRLTIPREEANFLFQTLIDKGLFEKPTEPDDIETADQIYVTANIQNKTVSYVNPVGDLDLAEQLRMIVMMFYHPRPRTVKP